MIGLCFISDRQDLYLPDCQESFGTNLHGHIDAVHTVDDHEHQLGLAGAVQAAWGWALDQNVDYLLHVEEDFTLDTPVRLDDLVYILERAPHLAQVVLKRQAWSAEERAAGGIIEMNPSDYIDCHSMRSTAWCEHMRIFSLNPCLIPRKVLEVGWPATNEAGFTEECRRHGLRFGFYGPKAAPPVVTHHGTHRAPGWRL